MLTIFAKLSTVETCGSFGYASAKVYETVNSWNTFLAYPQS